MEVNMDYSFGQNNPVGGKQSFPPTGFYTHVLITLLDASFIECFRIACGIA